MYTLSPPKKTAQGLGEKGGERMNRVASVAGRAVTRRGVAGGTSALAALSMQKPATAALISGWARLLPCVGNATPSPPSPWHGEGMRLQSTAAAQASESAPADGGEQPKKKPARAPRKKRDVLSMTEGAIERVKELLKGKEPAPHGIRLGVRTRGCNGLSYTLNYVYEAQKLDDIVEAGGVKVYIDPKAVMFLVGSKMDFVEDAVKVRAAILGKAAAMPTPINHGKEAQIFSISIIQTSLAYAVER